MYHSKFVKARLITLSLLKVVVGGGEIVYGTPSTTICIRNMFIRYYSSKDGSVSQRKHLQCFM